MDRGCGDTAFCVEGISEELGKSEQVMGEMGE